MPKETLSDICRLWVSVVDGVVGDGLGCFGEKHVLCERMSSLCSSHVRHAHFAVADMYFSGPGRQSC